MRRNEEGATAVEYAIMAVSIAAVIVAIVFVIGQQTRDMYCEPVTALEEHNVDAEGNGC